MSTPQGGSVLSACAPEGIPATDTHRFLKRDHGAADGVTARLGSTIGFHHAGRGSKSALDPRSRVHSTGCLAVKQQPFLRRSLGRSFAALLGIALWVATSLVFIQTSTATPARGLLPEPNALPTANQTAEVQRSTAEFDALAKRAGTSGVERQTECDCEEDKPTRTSSLFNFDGVDDPGPYLAALSITAAMVIILGAAAIRHRRYLETLRDGEPGAAAKTQGP